MICSPGRLAAPPVPIHFQTVEYLSSGRGKGRYHWEDAADSPEGRSILLSLQSRLVQALADVELALGLLPQPFYSVGLRIACAVRLSPALSHQVSPARHALMSPTRFKPL